jgi:tRNA threonylcarbamoyladenosine biosynthesis protein TsaE
MDLQFNLSTIKEAVQSLWHKGKDTKVWVFHGEMGAGKTTLIHALCEELGVKQAISSPTFAIINEYNSPVAGTIYHMDWYRMRDEEEAIQAGIEDCLLSGNYCFVEWPEKAENILPEKVFSVYLKATDHENRSLTLNV